MNIAGEIQRLAKHVSIYTIGNFLGRGGGFILIPLYTKFLVPAEYGMLELFYALAAMVMSLVSLGLAHATLRYYFEYDKPGDRNATISTSLFAAFAISFAGVLLLSTANPLICKYLFHGQDLGYALSLVYAGLVLETTTQVGLAYLRARELSKVFVLSSLTRLVTQIGANLLTVVVLKKGVEGILLGNLLAISAECAIAVYVTLKECGLCFQVEKLRSLVGYSYPFLLTGIIGVCVANFDRLFLSSMYTLDRVGVYALALKFGTLLSVFLIEPFQRGYGAFRFSIMKHENAREIQSRILIYLLSAVTLVGLFIALFSQEAIRLVGEVAYAEAAVIVPPIMLSISIGCMGYIFQTGILYQKRTQYIFYASSASSIVSVLCTFAGVKLWGMYGAVAAQVANALFNVCLINWFSQKVYPIPYPYGRIFLVYACGMLLFGIGQVLLLLPQWVSVPARGGLVILFAYGLVVLRIIRGNELRQALASIKTSTEKLVAILSPAK